MSRPTLLHRHSAKPQARPRTPFQLPAGGRQSMSAVDRQRALAEDTDHAWTSSPHFDQALLRQGPEAIVSWANRSFQDDLILTSSFGGESAVMLHLVTQIVPSIRVVFIDTGYLFPETYRFMET